MLNLISINDADRLRNFFLESDYTQAQIRDRIGLRELRSERLGNQSYLLQKITGDSSFHILLHWFFVGAPVSFKTAKEHISDDILCLLVEAGLISITPGHFLPMAMLVPFEHFLIASDPLTRAESDERKDLVLWPNPSSWLLWRFTIRKPFEAVLDLGSGCGMQAFSAATHAAEVTGVDLNDRATKFASFNARLNGIRNVEFLTGDSFAPVKKKTFDLIVSNPPFFIGPSNEDMYCDNPLELDQYCRSVVRDGALHLRENGFLQMVCEWVEVHNQSWQERITEWLENTHCDAWVLKAYAEQPWEYAHKRIQERSAGSSDKESAYLAHADYYNRLGVKFIYGGLIVLRRRSGANWIRWSELPASPKEPFGESIFQCFENRDFLLNNTGETLLDWRPRLRGDAVLQQQFQQSDQSWASEFLRLQLTRGIPQSIGIQPLVSAFVGRCDGSRPVKELVADLAESTDIPYKQVEQECLLVIRKLLEDGYLTS